MSTEEEQPKKKRKPEPVWFEVDDDHNTSVYVNNLPLTTTEEEFVDFMKKVGLIMKDDAGNWKIKLYKDKDGNFKGDALCRYIKRESVDLALQILDGYTLNGSVVSVEVARFSMKGDYDPSKKPRKKSAKEKRKEQKKIQKLFDWRPDRLPGERPNWEMVVIIENMFDITEFEKDPRLILEYKNDLRDECTEKCGEVKKVEIYDRNPNGAAAVHFKTFEQADQCVSLMNGRFFAGRQLKAYCWDGKTKYQVKETEEEAEARIKKWNDFLEKEDDAQPEKKAGSA